MRILRTTRFGLYWSGVHWYSNRRAWILSWYWFGWQKRLTVLGLEFYWWKKDTWGNNK